MSRHHRKLNRARWERLRVRVLDRDGWRCVKCGKAGRMEVDHIVPLEHGGAPWDEANLQSLDRACHILKTAGERPQPPQAVIDWRALVAERMSRS